jgi:Fic family protein
MKRNNTMIFTNPTLEPVDQEVLAMINEQRELLRFQVSQSPNRWQGFLRRNTFARALQGSNSIEGYNANLAEAVAIIDDEKTETLEEETVRALMGYRNAMTYILQIHDDPHTITDAQLIRSLHFMMISYDLTKLPGQWRPGMVVVVHEPTGDTVYEGPDPGAVPALMNELVEHINAVEGVDATVLGAMAHLNLAMIHPFRDGNGRMARALQTLVLAKRGITSPVFSSIEEWLGRNTEAYYAMLAEIGQGAWHPERDALPWVRFCLTAHFQQAATLMKRNSTVSAVWGEIEKIRRAHGFPERCDLPLMDAAFGYKVRNQRYREDQEISDVVASRDLKKLTDVNLLKPVGEKRGRYYIAGEPLRNLMLKHKDNSRAPNPYDLIKAKVGPAQLSLAL